jgi:hypothetical protein
MFMKGSANTWRQANLATKLSYKGVLMPYFQCLWLVVSTSLKLLHLNYFSAKIHAVLKGKKNPGTIMSCDGIASNPIVEENFLLFWTQNFFLHEVSFLVL